MGGGATEGVRTSAWLEATGLESRSGCVHFRGRNVQDEAEFGMWDEGNCHSNAGVLHSDDVLEGMGPSVGTNGRF